MRTWWAVIDVNSDGAPYSGDAADVYDSYEDAVAYARGCETRCAVFELREVPDGD